jgi:osmotically-inducible protein OsmY
MFGRHEISDKSLLKTINQRLSRTGSSSGSRITASVQQGTVTVTGKLLHEIQRSPIIKTVSRIAGVRRVIDQLQLAPKKIQQ